MYHQISLRFTLFLVLFNIYCSSSPLPFAEQDQATFVSNDIDDSERARLPTTFVDMIEPASAGNSKDSAYYLTLLCAIYDDCDGQGFNTLDRHQKRLTSSLFHGIPKFGKRGFTSAFSGIPKFG
jgi:hypothetical protein